MNGNVILESPLDNSGEWKSWFHPPRWLYDSLGEEYFSNIKTVQIFGIYVHGLDPEVTQAIASLPGLIRVELHESQSNADPARIATLANVKEFHVSGRAYCTAPEPKGMGKDECRPFKPGASEPTSASFCLLSRMKKLQKVEFGNVVAVDAAMLEALTTLPDLRALRITTWSQIDSAELAALAKFNRLQSLEIRASVRLSIEQFNSHSRPIISGPLPIRSWTELRSLSLDAVVLSPEELQAITQLNKLESLKLEVIGIRDGELHHRSVGDRDLLLLREIKGLKQLKIARDEYSPQAINALQAALPNLVIESL
jgi:hypothetical protein